MRTLQTFVDARGLYSVVIFDPEAAPASAEEKAARRVYVFPAVPAIPSETVEQYAARSEAARASYELEAERLYKFEFVPPAPPAVITSREFDPMAAELVPVSCAPASWQTPAASFQPRHASPKEMPAEEMPAAEKKHGEKKRGGKHRDD